MKPVTADDIRAAMVNCSKGEAKRLTLPRDLAGQPWDDLDFLGWRDPSGSDRGCIVSEHEGTLTGVLLRCVPPTAAGRPLAGRSTMCSLCMTTHPGTGVTLMTAARRKNRTDSVGIRICADLDCSLYLRGLKEPAPGGARMLDTLSVDQRSTRLKNSLELFLNRV